MLVRYILEVLILKLFPYLFVFQPLHQVSQKHSVLWLDMNYSEKVLQRGETGSSAMPHKMNSRSCERINGFQAILNGHLTMVSNLSGDQWNEGDVSCSVVRRVALPDAFFAIDGLLDTFLTVLSQMEVFPAMIESEVNHYLPFLLTTTIMMEAVKSGGWSRRCSFSYKTTCSSDC